MDIITYGLLNKKIKKKADIDSPHFTGEPTAPTPEKGDDSERLATTEFVQDAIKDIPGGTDTKYTLSIDGTTIILTGTDDTTSTAELPYKIATTDYWNSHSFLVSEKDVLYIYTDYRTTADGDVCAGVKIGDGLAYLIDLPFQNEDYLEHIQNEVIHITAEERAKWNDKVTCYIDPIVTDRLVFSKN